VAKEVFWCPIMAYLSLPNSPLQTFFIGTRTRT